MMTMITVEDLKSAYGRKQILKGASFMAGQGDCVGIVGANGCGKSTLLSILAGTLRPKAGRVLYGGAPAWQGGAAGHMRADMGTIRRMTGYVPQDNPLIPELTVLDNLRLWYPDRDVLQWQLQQGVLKMLGVDGFSRMQASKLSGGMKKRVSIGIAMASNPPILLLDEPSAALDLICKEDIRKYLQAYLQHQGTVVITTHEESELDLCSRIYVMNDGRLRPIDRSLRGEALVREF